MTIIYRNSKELYKKILLHVIPVSTIAYRKFCEKRSCSPFSHCSNIVHQIFMGIIHIAQCFKPI